MDHSPPPLFKQGPSALARLIVFVVLALALLVADARFNALGAVRQVFGTLLYPFQRAALAPRDLAVSIADYFASGERLRAENAQLRSRNLELGLEASRAASQRIELEHLRALLTLEQHAPVRPIPAEIEYDARDPFTQKVVINRGLHAGIEDGAPVVNETGLVGQVTRVYPLNAEVTLLTDRDQAVPVQNLRTGVRSVVYGTSRGNLLELRFVPNGADIVVGDELVTGGLDGVYPQGLPVARVVQVERQSEQAFANVTALPVAGIGGARALLVLRYKPALTPLVAEPSASRSGPASPASPASPSSPSSAAQAAKPGTAPKSANASKPANVSRPANPSATRSAAAKSARPDAHRAPHAVEPKR